MPRTRSTPLDDAAADLLESLHNTPANRKKEALKRKKAAESAAAAAKLLEASEAAARKAEEARGRAAKANESPYDRFPDKIAILLHQSDHNIRFYTDKKIIYNNLLVRCNKRDHAASIDRIRRRIKGCSEEIKVLKARRDDVLEQAEAALLKQAKGKGKKAGTKEVFDPEPFISDSEEDEDSTKKWNPDDELSPSVGSFGGVSIASGDELGSEAVDEGGAATGDVGVEDQSTDEQ